MSLGLGGGPSKVKVHFDKCLYSSNSGDRCNWLNGWYERNDCDILENGYLHYLDRFPSGVITRNREVHVS